MSPPSVPIAVLSIPVTEQIAWSGIERKRLDELPSNPGACGMFGHVEMNDVSPVVMQNLEGVEDSEGRRWHGEQINRRDVLGMILQERPPPLRRRAAVMHHVL